MKKQDADSELEFLETSAEAKAAGLRRIKRRHYYGPADALPDESRIEITVSLDPEVADHFKEDPRRINEVLRSAINKKKLARDLLDDEDFIEGIKSKLAA